jgi:hypothetical protein
LVAMVDFPTPPFGLATTTTGMSNSWFLGRAAGTGAVALCYRHG